MLHPKFDLQKFPILLFEDPQDNAFHIQSLECHLGRKITELKNEVKICTIINPICSKITDSFVVVAQDLGEDNCIKFWRIYVK